MKRARGRVAILAVITAATSLTTAPAIGSVDATRAVGDVEGAPTVYRDVLEAVSACEAGETACVKERFTAWRDSVASGIDGLRAGRSGLADWIRFGASLHHGPTGATTAPPEVADAVRAVYAAAGVPADATVLASAQRQIQSMSRAESREISRLLGAFAVSLRLQEQARGAGAIARFSSDPRHLHQVAMGGLRAQTPTAEEAEALDAIGAVDMTRMSTAARVAADAIARFRPEVVGGGLDLPLIFIGGEGETVHDEDRLLSVDVGGADTYSNNAGGGLVGNPLPNLYSFGGSIAIDYGADDDAYETLISGQGFAVGAVGILYDEGGSDTYHLVDAYGHGAALAGIGVLYDAGQGSDQYLTVWEEGELGPTATKGSTLAGIGMLVDEGGADVFRQDGVDGIGWAAARGVGLVASLGPGDDLFRSDGTGPTNQVGVMQGNAEFMGTGILYDEAGNDTYECNGNIRQGCQGTGADAGLGLLWDRGGDDVYRTAYTDWCDLVNDNLACFGGADVDAVNTDPVEFPIMVVGQGAGYMTVPPGPPGMGVLYDESGDDTYVAPKWAQGYGVFGNVGLLYDAGGGTDVYGAPAPLVGARADANTWLDGSLGIGIDE